MARTKNIPNDEIPYRAGVVILTPLDANMKPDGARSVATQYDFLTSTQTTVTRTTETLPNGNGQDKEFVTDETYNVTVTGNTFNPVFHAVVTGRIETLPEKVLTREQFTRNLPATVEAGGVLEITFGPGKDWDDIPAADDDGNYNFVVEDSYGNNLVKREKPVYGAYAYDPDTHALQFSEEYKGAQIRVIYQQESTDSIVYSGNPILQQPEFQVEIFGLSQSAGTDQKVKVYTKIKRATATGDVSDMTTQKSKSAPITYNFKSAPVPEGVSPYTQVFTPVTSTIASDDNIVNGGDDDFGDTKPEGPPEDEKPGGDEQT